MHEEQLDWSQSKVFIVILTFIAVDMLHVVTCSLQVLSLNF